MVKYDLSYVVRGDNLRIGDKSEFGTVRKIVLHTNTDRTVTFCNGDTLVVQNFEKFKITRTTMRTNGGGREAYHPQHREHMIEDYLFLVQNGEDRGRVMLRVNPKWKPSTWRQYLFEAGHNEEAHTLYQYIKEQEK